MNCIRKLGMGLGITVAVTMAAGLHAQAGTAIGAGAGAINSAVAGDALVRVHGCHRYCAPRRGGAHAHDRRCFIVPCPQRPPTRYRYLRYR